MTEAESKRNFIIKLIAGISLIVAMFYGWISNIITLVSSDYMGLGELAVRIIGIFIAPIGIIAGYF